MPPEYNPIVNRDGVATELFFEQLAALPGFTSHDQALAEIGRVLTEVEDAHSGVARDPTDLPAVTGGRMYPPHPAYSEATEIKDVILYTQRRHQTYKAMLRLWAADWK